jgi:hypothetical protein
MGESVLENINTLSDEDFLNQAETLESEIEKVANEPEEEESSDNVNEVSETVEEEEEVESTETVEEDTSVEPESSGIDTPEEKEEGEEEEVKEEETPSDEAVISKEDQLAAIYAPFKANGVEISVSSPEEAIRLMQQGAGAAKRIQELAPKLKLIQMLENNDLLDEQALNRLIAFNSKDPKAIAAFLKEADIDPFTLDTDSEEEYTPKDYSVSDSEFVLKQTLTQLADQPKYQETLDTADSWDEKSQQMVLDDPEILLTLNGHIQSGIYDQVATIVKQEQIKGNIANGIPFLEAYRYVGNQLQQAGAFDQGNSVSSNEQTSDNTNSKPNEGNAKLNSRRKSAGVTKSGSPKQSAKSENTNSAELFKMSDEEFMEKFADAEWMNPM